jgi:hypothetical protein
MTSSGEGEAAELTVRDPAPSIVPRPPWQLGMEGGPAMAPIEPKRVMVYLTQPNIIAK